MSVTATLTIGQVAERAGINASAIRFYEREGLLPEPERTGGQRRYDEETVRRLEVIDIAKRAGFTLPEVKVLLETADSGEDQHAVLSELADRKLAEVDALIARAQAMRKWLLKARDCGCPTVELCWLFDEACRERPAT